jgi:hypothetical protein
MVTNSISPFFGKLFEPIITALIRWLDRGCLKHLLKVNNIIEEKQAEYEKQKAERAKGREARKKDLMKKEGGEVELSTVQFDGGDSLEEPGDDEYAEESPEAGKTAKGGDHAHTHDIEVDLDEPETKLIFQDELNEQYTNKPI